MNLNDIRIERDLDAAYHELERAVSYEKAKEIWMHIIWIESIRAHLTLSDSPYIH